MSREMNNVDEFLNHKAQDRSGGFLSKWKKNRKVTTWIHTKRLPIALWQHKLPRIYVAENKQTGEAVKHIYSGSHNCYEDEAVLKKQYRRRRDDGVREVPPLHCPMCRLIDTVQTMIADGKLNWTKPLFRFEGDDPKETKVLHAGGICNMFTKDDLSQQQKDEMRKASISPMEAWSENAFAKMNYVMCVVDHDNPGEGVQIAIEGSLLGDKVKDVINDARESLGVEEGNPFLHPFAIQWEHKPEAPEFNKKYHARRLEKVKLTPEIAKLIRGEPPDLDRVLAPFDIKTMRAFLERHCLVKNLPWDDIFDVRARERTRSDESSKEVERSSSTRASDEAEDDDDTIACDECGTPMEETDTKCSKCGAEYGPEAIQPPPPPPVGRRGKSAAKPPSPPSPPPPRDARDEDEGDAIPFD